MSNKEAPVDWDRRVVAHAAELGEPVYFFPDAPDFAAGVTMTPRSATSLARVLEAAGELTTAELDMLRVHIEQMLSDRKKCIPLADASVARVLMGRPR